MLLLAPSILMFEIDKNAQKCYHINDIFVENNEV